MKNVKFNLKTTTDVSMITESNIKAVDLERQAINTKKSVLIVTE